MDKVKDTAQQASTAAKGKVDDVKDKRKLDDLLDDLGRAVYLEKTDRKAEDHDEKVASLVQQIKELEADGVEIKDKG